VGFREYEHNYSSSNLTVNRCLRGARTSRFAHADRTLAHALSEWNFSALADAGLLGNTRHWQEWAVEA